ncbi:MAG: hypothetical protein ACRDHL_03755, partial [Candidatus Promineifilaceae bacterium]
AGLAEALGDWLPFWKRELDLVALGWADGANLAEALGGYRARLLLAGAAAGGTASVSAAPARYVLAGEALDLGDGVRLEVLAPAAGREGQGAGLTLRLDYGELGLLLLGAAGPEAEAALLASGRPLEADLLWTAGAAGEALLAAVRPQVVVYTGAGPAGPDLLGWAAAGGASLVSPAEPGEVELVSDGRAIWWAGRR